MSIKDILCYETKGTCLRCMCDMSVAINSLANWIGFSVFITIILSSISLLTYTPCYKTLRTKKIFVIFHFTGRTKTSIFV